MQNVNNWLGVPEPISMAYDFVMKTNDDKMSGLSLNEEHVLASMAACRALRAYFDRVTYDVEEGQYDPEHILEVEMMCDENLEHDHGEEGYES